MNNRNMLLNAQWEFVKLPVNSGIEAFRECVNLSAVNLPHDWLIYDTNNLYESSEGWYRRTVNCEKGYNYALEFGGVYMNSTVYVNGTEAYTCRNGYTAFSADITGFISEGDNEILVQVRHEAPNSRWYSGAGIYRSVYLVKTKPVHIAYKGVYISADAKSGSVAVKTEFTGDADFVKHTVYDGDGTAVCAVQADAGETAVMEVENHKLWGLETPELYTLKTELIECGITVDCVFEHFGFRELVFDPDKGFFLNGENMKIKGVCKHHDLGSLGAAMNYDALYRQIMLFKEMGVNAVRTSHNMPSFEIMDICDRVGMLIDAESFDMWELPKTEFDNHRFFRETARSDIESLVRVCRNHPSLMMWCIGNEIYDTHSSDRGYETAEMLVSCVREFDPAHNAPCTIGSNFIEWERSQKIGEMLGLSGYNYTEKCYDAHHIKYPGTVIYGSETSSAVCSRGVYHFPAGLPLLSHDDNQCSSLDNSVVNWGRTAEDAWIMDRDRRFCAGQFVWTGIDYIGEPTPYNTKNSYFGMIDTAGFPKDIYYFYQSVWTDFIKKPMIHLLPYWDFNDGQLIDVIAYTNCPECELFLNGTSLGKRSIDHEKGNTVHASWQVPYENGILTVRGNDYNGNILCTDEQRSFGDPVRITLSADKEEINADGTSLCFIEISAVDNNGVFCANARNRISVEVSGEGRLLGLDNGDSTDYEQYKTTNRRLFSGKLAAIIGSTLKSGAISVKVSSKGLEDAECVIKTIPPCNAVTGITALNEVTYTEPADDIPIRKITPVINTAGSKLCMDENNRTVNFSYKILPNNASYSDISCKAVKTNGVLHNCCAAECKDGIITVNASGDGEGFIRIYAYNGSKYPQVISDLPFEICGLGEAVRNPYEMLSGCTYNISSIPLNIIENGALGGFSQKCYLGFTSLDFGRTGSKMLRIHAGNSSGSNIPFEIWDGIPNQEKSRLIYTAKFPHNNGWGSFMPCDFILPEKITGVHTVSVVIKDKCIFGGLEFIAHNKAFEKLEAGSYDEIYGDAYKTDGGSITQIGNNTVIGFSGLDFGEGVNSIKICGRTPNEINTIQLRYEDNGKGKTQLLEFAYSEDYTEQTFALEKISGMNKISFVFMPGSNFDFSWFKFEE